MTTTPSTTGPLTGRPAAARPLATDGRGALALARRSWSLDAVGGPLRVRGAVPADLRQVALMHGRCSADTLLQRYLAGGRAPSLALVSAMLTQPLVLVAQAPGGDVVALATAVRAPLPGAGASASGRELHFGLVVEDAWQRRGVGRALAAHVAAAAHLLGVRELVADTAAPTLPLRRVLDGVGPTRSSRTDLGARLHTRLDLSALAGLGSLRAVLAG